MVFVLSKTKKPLMPCHPARARELLKKGRAVVHKVYPFTIRLKDRVEGDVQPIREKVDPGAKTTGIALESEGKRVLFFAELNHKTTIHDNMRKRANYRGRRRSANLRYRAPRFNNRTRPNGWLPPSLQSRVDAITSWTVRFKKLCPVTDCSVETVRFDTQKLQNPEINGVEYQQGELFGYEVREYLLEKWGRKCAYCGKENVPLEIEHIIPKSRGGTSRVSNLTLACYTCNEKKGNKTAAEFGYPEVQKKAKVPLKQAAIVNATRNALYRELSKLFIKWVEVSTGGRTKYNRTRLGLPKTHYFDALCVGKSTPTQPGSFRNIDSTPVLSITCKGKGQYRRTNVNKYGFPRLYLMRQKMVNGFQTGDMVKTVIPKGKYSGRYRGVLAVRKTGYFGLYRNKKLVAEGVKAPNTLLVQRFDGYTYSLQSPDSSPT